MGLMDEATSKFSNMEEMKQKYEDLKNKENSGELDDAGRQELQQLRGHFEK